MKYTLKTGDTLKCSACGNDEFEQKKMAMGHEPCWCHICTKCSNMMSFMEANKAEK